MHGRNIPTRKSKCGSGVTSFRYLPKVKGKSAAITGAGVDVAVLDTGVTVTVPQEGNAQGSPTLENVVDGPDLSFDALNDELRFEDVHGHGTNMAGIIAASDQLSYGSGVAPGSRIIDVRVGAADGSVDVSQVIAAINWTVENRNANGMNTRVIELAYDTDADVDYRYDPLSFAVENAWHNGIVVVVAGGNDGRGISRLGNPAIDPYIIAVGASELGGSGWKVPAWSAIRAGMGPPGQAQPGPEPPGHSSPEIGLSSRYEPVGLTSTMRGGRTGQRPGSPHPGSPRNTWSVRHIQ